MTDTPAFSLVPGFDFLQTLVKSAGSALPGIGQWVAPTLDPAELEKRINELRTVQFWLEQNARMLGTTIQALEVQRMTLSTLKTMNVQMEDLRESMQIRMPTVTPPAAAPAPPPAATAPSIPAPSAANGPAGPAAPAPGAVDPLQWWSALTKQFTEIATTAMKDTAADAGRQVAGGRMKAALQPADPAAATAARKPKAAARKSPAARKAAGSP